MGEDQNALLRQIAVDVAIIKTKVEETDKLKHEERLSKLEAIVNQWTGSKVLLLWFITTGLAVAALFRH